MKQFLLITFLVPIVARAHCPLEFTIEDEIYCTQETWQTTEQKAQGLLVENPQMSPYLIPKGEVPPRWLYTKISFLVWKKADASMTPQRIEGWRVFPHMTMENGHHHSASYQFTWDASSNAFILSGLALQSMRGCWSLRWTIENQDSVVSSEKLIDISNYTNLSDEENSVMDMFCKMESASQTEGSHEH